MRLFTPTPFVPTSPREPSREHAMPIVLARVDNRLVHGQILSAWLPALGADALLVADDEAARNPLVRSAMEIAIPPDVQFDVVPVENIAAAVKKIPAARL